MIIEYNIKNSDIIVQTFTLLPEYFIAISLIYVLIIITMSIHTASLHIEIEEEYEKLREEERKKEKAKELSMLNSDDKENSTKSSTKNSDDDNKKKIIHGLTYQKSLSQCLAVICFMAFYLIINEDFVICAVPLLNESILNDYLSVIAKSILTLFTGCYFLIIADSLNSQRLNSYEYLLIFLCALLGLLLLCGSYDFLLIYLSLEMSGLALSVVVAARRDSIYSIESGIKYFIVNAIASSILLLSVSYLYYIFSPTSIVDCFDLASVDPEYGQELVYWPSGFISLFFENVPPYPAGFVAGYEWIFFDYRFDYYNIFWDYFHIFLSGAYDDEENTYLLVTLPYLLIFTSLSIKLGLAPFYGWSVEVYEDAPTSTSFFLAAISKLSIFVLAIRFYSAVVYTVSSTVFREYLFIMGFLSVIIGAFGGLRQRKLKSLLAYSSLSHMGYAVIALSVHQHYMDLVLFYVIVYMFSSFCTWPVLLFTKVKTVHGGHYSKTLGDLALLSKSNKVLAVVLTLSMFSLAGIPPLFGFYAKFSILLPIILDFNFFIIIFIALCSVVSTFYYLRVIKLLYFENIRVGRLYYPLKSENTILISIFTFLLVFFFLNPYLLICLCEIAVVDSLPY